MSVVPIAAAKSAEACANCGKESSDIVKLRNCTACYLVKYCSVDCQKNHLKKHKKACKERAAEFKDEKLYGQGHERPAFGYCPICFLAIPIRTQDHSVFYSCCMKSVCDGCCIMAFEQGYGADCPFCRTPEAENDDLVLGMIQKRVAARDPIAIRRLGDFHLTGECGLEKNTTRALELWTEAAELGSMEALFKLGIAVHQGELGVAQDEIKGIRYWEAAAMQGCAESRHMLGFVELKNSNCDRAVRHFLISAKMGFKDSLDKIKEMFANGHATKAQYAEGLTGYQDAVEAMKSPERDKALATFGAQHDALKAFTGR
ncbi:hypothetical protein THAOC_18816 [Thalassiosira oceanica]|uniref:MYND-type domain-containing protein n=1 Tax=Thalassiosira oceanica TaxID=159749 RepID=K0S790_THAOC|nr:hypothetical protein THAOC_18816 [Thalassiosira oceanica]|eukprot:EJK60774.1 hypothetical protein THAOC_18816 [Thalassiosira oceanica]